MANDKGVGTALLAAVGTDVFTPAEAAKKLGWPLEKAQANTYRLTRQGSLVKVDEGKWQAAQAAKAKERDRKVGASPAHAAPYGENVVAVGHPDQLPPFPAAPLDAAIDTFTRALTDHILSRVTANVEAQVEARLAALLERKALNLQPTPIGIGTGEPERIFPAEARTPDQPRPIKASEPKRRKVVIIGLINQQAQEVRKDYGHLFDLRTPSTDEAVGKDLKNLTEGAAAVIVMTRFISHKVQDTLRACGREITYCNGAVSSLRAQLQDLHTAKVAA